MSKDKDLTQKMFDYIALLEQTNDELIFTLKQLFAWPLFIYWPP